MNGPAVLGHLERQLVSARRLLGIVLAQTEAIKTQDVEGVLARLAEMQSELASRHALELERDEIIRTAATQAHLAPASVDLELLAAGLPPDDGERARSMSAELRGLLTEVGHVHEQNRVLIRQELVFLGHLMRVLSGAPQAGYSSTGWLPEPQAVSAVDARA